MQHQQKQICLLLSAPIGALVFAILLISLFQPQNVWAQAPAVNVDLQVSLPSNTALNAGGMVQYHARVVNFGSEVPPATLTISSNNPHAVRIQTAFPGCVPTDRGIACSLEKIPAGRQLSIPITLTVASTATQGVVDISHQLIVPENVQGEVTRSSVLTILPQVDLAVKVTGPMTTFVQAENTTNIRFEIQNTSTFSATWVRATIVQTASVEHAVEWPANCPINSTNTLIRDCRFREIMPGATAYFEITVFFMTPGTYCYWFSTKDLIDDKPENNSSQHCVTVLPQQIGDLQLAVNAPLTATIKSPLQLTARVTNAGEVALIPQVFFQLTGALSVTDASGGACSFMVSTPDQNKPTITLVACYLAPLDPELVTAANNDLLPVVHEDFSSLNWMQFINGKVKAAPRDQLNPRDMSTLILELLPHQPGALCYTSDVNFIQEGVKEDPTPLNNHQEGCIEVIQPSLRLYLPLIIR